MGKKFRAFVYCLYTHSESVNHLGAALKVQLAHFRCFMVQCAFCVEVRCACIYTCCWAKTPIPQFLLHIADDTIIHGSRGSLGSLLSIILCLFADKKIKIKNKILLKEYECTKL